MFIQTTDRLLSDPDLLRQNQMDIQVEEEIPTRKDINEDEEIKDPNVEGSEEVMRDP
jgi:hypothetical protein